jgi:hypothetical protein
MLDAGHDDETVPLEVGALQLGRRSGCSVDDLLERRDGIDQGSERRPATCCSFVPPRWDPPQTGLKTLAGGG